MLFCKILKSAACAGQLTQHRFISVSAALCGKRNFRKFHFPNRRGNKEDLLWLRDHPEEYDRRGVREWGYFKDRKHIPIPELIPELIVPDLTDFQLKPYVSYRAPDVTQEKFTPEHLFYAVYSEKIIKDFNAGKLDNEGNSLNPSENEKMTKEEAKQKALSTGSDLFG